MGGRGVDIEASLARKINVPEVRSLAVWAAETSDNRLRLWNLAKSDDRRVSVNALWVMTHLAQSEPEWAASLQDELIDMVVVESDMAKKRMLLQILKCQEFDMENIRTDFLDWCLSKINSECEPCAVRTFSIDDVASTAIGRTDVRASPYRRSDWKNGKCPVAVKGCLSRWPIFF